MVDRPLNKHQQLLIAGVVAPIIRRSDKKNRVVKTVDKDGNVIREITLGDVQQSILDHAEIQFDVDHRPERLLCTRCRKVLKIPKKGKVRTACDRCRLRLKHEHDPPEVRFRFLQKMVAIAQTGKIPPWLPMSEYKRRYGERPPVEWLERVGIR